MDRCLRILACWPYSRRGWVAPLEGLAARGHDVTYLAYRRREEEPAGVAIPPDRPRAYWRDFRNGQDVLRRLRPDRVVLMGTEGAWTIGVVAAARASGVPTAVLQHGVFRPSPAHPVATLAQRAPAFGRPLRRAQLPALAFLAGSLRRRPDQVVAAVRFLVAASRSTVQMAAPRHPLPVRSADAYLVASARAGRYFEELDAVAADRIVPVGLAEFDDLLQRRLPTGPARAALLIDTPHTGGPHGAATMPGAEKAAAIRRLGTELARAGWALTVKLHPDSYGDDWAVDDDAVRYVREADPGDLLAGAAVALGFDSTLLVPALHHRPGLLLHTAAPGWFQALAADLGAARSSVQLTEVTARDVAAAAAAADETRAGRTALVRELLGPPDGRSLDRIEQALVDLDVTDRTGRRRQ